MRLEELTDRDVMYHILGQLQVLPNGCSCSIVARRLGMSMTTLVSVARAYPTVFETSTDADPVIWAM